MDRMHIAVVMPEGAVRDSFIPPGAVTRLEGLGEVSWNTSDRQYTRDEMAEIVKATDVCVTGWGCPQFNEGILGENPRLKLVAHTGGTVAPLVSRELYDKGIKVISGNKVYAESVAEGTIAYILAALRNLPHFSESMHDNGWVSWDSLLATRNEGLLGKTIGLVGFGAIARYMVPMLRGFRTKLFAYDPHVADEVFEVYGVTRLRSLDTMFPMVDIISLHLPITPETYHLIDKELLALVKDGALFVNTARGACVDEDALAVELASGRFKAALDVFENEPLPTDSRLRGLPNCMLMPHMAGPTLDRHESITMGLADDIERFFSGLPMINEIGFDYAVAMTNEGAIEHLKKS